MNQLCFLRSKSVGKEKHDSRWEEGIWLGIREESGENVVGTNTGVLKARTSKRKAEDTKRWQNEIFDLFIVFISSSKFFFVLISTRWSYIITLRFCFRILQCNYREHRQQTQFTLVVPSF